MGNNKLEEEKKKEAMHNQAVAQITNEIQQGMKRTAEFKLQCIDRALTFAKIRRIKKIDDVIDIAETIANRAGTMSQPELNELHGLIEEAIEQTFAHEYKKK